MRMLERYLVLSFIAGIAALTHQRYGIAPACVFTLLAVASVWAVSKIGGAA